MASTPFAQSNNDETKIDIRLRNDKPTVYIEYVCQDEEKIFLRMHNNTIWHIGVGAEKSYFPTKKPIKLGNGNKGYAIPNNEEVPLHYKIEQDELGNEKKMEVPKQKLYYYPNVRGRIASEDFIKFAVPIGHLQDGLKISVRFSFEWELITSFHLAREPVHRVYFQGSEIGSENTGIEPVACPK